MNTREADAPEEPQNQRQREAVGEPGEGQTGSRPKHRAARVEPSTIRAIGSARQEGNRDRISSKVDTTDPARLARIKRPLGGDFVQGRREGHLRREICHQTE